MSEYDDQIAIDLPVWYIKGTEPHGAVVLADSSGNGEDALVLDDALLQSMVGPIETDTPNWGARAQPTPIGGSGIFGIARLPDPVPAIIDPRTTLSYVVWAYAISGVVNQAMRRSGNVISGSGNLLGISGTTAVFKLSFPSGAFQINQTGLATDAWHQLALTRSGTVMRAYVNTVLVGEETVPAGEDISLAVDNGWLLGTQILTHACPGATRWLVYDYALTQAQITAQYEAAILAVFLNGYSNVIPTAILYSDIEPTPTHFPFRHNWADALIERISFRTNISTARTGSEEGAATRARPRREIEFVQVLRDDAERRALRARLWAHQHRKWFIPILEDREQLVVGVAAGAGSIPATTVLKDYAVGGYCELRQLNDAGVITKSEVLEVLSFSASAIIPVTAPVNAYDAFVSTVGPVRRGYIDSQLSVRGHADSVEEATIIARLLSEDEDAVPNRITAFTPAIKYRDYEVLHGWQSNDWSELREYEVERVLSDADYDTGIFSPHSDTPGAAEAFSYRMVIKGRESIAAFLGWFYERAGSLTYLWVPTMQRDFEVVGSAFDQLTVTGTEYGDNYALAEARRDIAFVYEDGSLELRRVVGFSGTVNETLELDENVPMLTGLRSVSLLKFCRLDGDTLEIAKVTDDLWVFAWRFRELLETPAGTGASSLSPSASMSPSRSPSASQSPSASVSASISPSASRSPSASISPSGSVSPSGSASLSRSPSASVSPSSSTSPSGSASPSA